MVQKVAMLLDHPGHFDSRVARECAILSEAGYTVKVFCLNQDASARNFRIGKTEYVQCFEDKQATIPVLSKISHFMKRRQRNAPQHKRSVGGSPSLVDSRKSVGAFKKNLGLAFSFSQNYKSVLASVTTFAPDIVHAHDLTMLYAGRRLAQSLGAKLIYDSHEYERHRNVVISTRAHKIRMRSERKNIAFTDRVITVSDSIADALSEYYKIDWPFVYLNVGPEYNSAVKSTPVSRTDLGLPQDEIIGIYTGNMMLGRGLEEAMEALAFTPNVHLAILGDAPVHRRIALQKIAQDLAVTARVYTLPAVPEADIPAVMQLADFAWIPIQNSCQSYNFALPNKLFQSESAGLPIFATPLLEISRFVEHFSLGTIAKGFDGRSQAESLKEFLIDLHHPPCRKNAQDLPAYSNEAMRAGLLKVYASLDKQCEKYVPLPLPHMQAKT